MKTAGPFVRLPGWKNGATCTDKEQLNGNQENQEYREVWEDQ